jgi:hypothetical protein
MSYEAMSRGYPWEVLEEAIHDSIKQIRRTLDDSLEQIDLVPEFGTLKVEVNYQPAYASFEVNTHIKAHSMAR